MNTDNEKTDPVAGDHQLAIAEMRKQLAVYEKTLQQAKAADADDDDVIDLRELWNVLMRRRRTVFTTMLAVVVAALLFTAMQTPIYRGSTTMQLESESAKVVEFDDVVKQDTNTRDFYETQYELLRSRSLARRVIDQLGMYQAGVPKQDESIFAQLKASVLGLLANAAEAGQGESGAEEAAPDLETAFLESLTVEPVRNSRLVRLHFNSPDAKEAALVVNTLARAFVDMNLERRYEASTYAKSFLEERIKQVRADLEDSERRFMLYTQERGIISQENKLGVLTAKLQELSTALVAAEAARIGAESRYQETLTVDAGTLMQMLQNETIEKLRASKVELQTQRTEQARLYKPSYPAMQQLDRKIAELDAEIAAEVTSMRRGIQAEYQTRLREEAKLQESIKATRQEILDLEERSTDFTTLKREVDTNRELYDGLLQRMKEVGVAAGIAANNISVVDPAAVPQFPYSPKLLLNLAVALVLGLFGGVGLALLFEMLDDTVKGNEALEKLMDKPVLGVIPKVGAKGGEREVGLMAYHEPTSAFAEAYRSMRTALMFSTAEGAPRVLHFTSASPGEGKSTTAVSTAINFAQTGAKVLLIDADLRNPSLHKVFGLPNHRGLTNYLTGSTEPGEVTQACGVQGLFLISSGPLPPNPAELLMGGRMMDLATLAAKRFDYVVIDSPPLLGLADALILADVANATLMVVAANSTRLGAVEAGLKRLRHSRARVLGSVLTKFDLSKASYGYGYDYQYSYSYGGTSAEAPAGQQRA